MSQVQEAAHEIVTQLVQDNWSDLCTSNAGTLSAWASLTTMVLEWADPESVGTSQAARTWTMQTRKPPPNWFVLIGRYSDEKELTPLFNHFGGSAQFHTDKHVEQLHGYFQTTCFALGNLLVYTQQEERWNQRVIEVFINAISAQFNLVQLLPCKNNSMEKPSAIHDYGSFDLISNRYAKYMGLGVQSFVDR